ncbi:MAG: hypothetical protein ACPGU1_14305 [Myxococcota bacterium]
MTRFAPTLTLCLLLFACEAAAPPAQDIQNAVDDVATCSAGDECGPAQDALTPDDAAQPAEDIVAPEPFFEAGTNVTGANTPDSFSPLVNGDELNIELGFQGLWMVVLAFRTRDIFQGKVTIVARITVDEEPQGEIGLAKQKLIPGGNDVDYYYNLFLVVMDPQVSGSEALIKLTVQDDHGAVLKEDLYVQLTGGSAP